MDDVLLDVKITVNVTLNFLKNTLLCESLTPNTEQEKDDIVNMMEKLTDKLNSLNSIEEGTLKRKKKSEKREKRPSFALSSFLGEDDHKTKISAKKSAPIEHPEEAEVTEEEYEFLDQHMQGKILEQTATQDDLTQKVSLYSSMSLAKLKETSTYHGFLLKHKNRLFMKWHQRFCILKDQFLFYFKSEFATKEQGVIIVPGYTLSQKEKGFVFNLEPIDETRDSYTFQSDSTSDFDNWWKHLSALTSQTLSGENMRVINDVSSERFDEDDTDSSGGARVQDICEDLKANVDRVKPVQEDIYDGIIDEEEINDGAVDGDSVKTEKSKVDSFSMENIYVSLSHCQADDPLDLTFNKGDVVYLMSHVDENWCVGYSNGKSGLVPKNFLTAAFK